jgi:isopentenyl diphosphate isomerase/L-lactate dehydrogenase-like FMN-dependent dehydrogenase
VIIVDSSFRRGSDVLKGIAFGASLVALCRPILYGLAAAGREGVAGVIREITRELERIMGLVGVGELGQFQTSLEAVGKCPSAIRQAHGPE